MHLFLQGDNRDAKGNRIALEGNNRRFLSPRLPTYTPVGEVAREIAREGWGYIYGENSRTWFSWLVPGTVEIHHISSVMPRNAAGRCTLHINGAREAYRATLLHEDVFRTQDFRLSGCNTHRKSAALNILLSIPFKFRLFPLFSLPPSFSLSLSVGIIFALQTRFNAISRILPPRFLSNVEEDEETSNSRRGSIFETILVVVRKEARYIPRVSRVNVFGGYVVISVMNVLTSKSRVYLWKHRHLEFHEIISNTDLV